MKPLFGWEDSFATDRNIILFAAGFALLWNLFNVGLLGKLAEWGMIVEILVTIGVVVLVFALGPKDLGTLVDMSRVVTDAAGQASVESLSFSEWIPALFGGGIFVSYWVMYTFENGGTLGEETKDASRNAPKAILGAFTFAAVSGVIFFVCLTASLADPFKSMLAGTPAEDAIGLHLPTWVVKLFLAVLVEGLIIATSTMFAGATRHLFGMARDNQIPFGQVLTRTNKAGQPWPAALLLTGLSLLPVFVFKAKAASMVGAATAAMYTSYSLVALVALWAVLKGWPRKRAAFDLGRWNLPVALVAAAGAVFTTVNLLWARASTNPTYDQITGEVTSAWYRHIPMGWYIAGVPILVGAAYYFRWRRKMQNQQDVVGGRVDHGELTRR